MIRRFALGVVSAVALAGVAQAADLPVKAPIYKAPPPVASFSWTGCYFGGNTGWLGNDSTLTTSPSGSIASYAPEATYAYDLKDSAFAGGVSYGCNRQYGQFVVGLDSDFDFTSLNDGVDLVHPAVGLVGSHIEALTQKLTWFSTTRARIGWAHDRWMIFAAGGLASGHIKSTTYLSGGVDTYSGEDNTTRYGWTIGGGVEYALSQNWFLRGEYLYIDLGKYDYTSDHVPPDTRTWNTEVDTKVQTARVALTYRFTRAGSLLEWAMGGFKY